MPKTTVTEDNGWDMMESRVVASREAGARLERSLGRRVNSGVEIELVPELTRADAALADYARLPEATECEDQFGIVFRSVLQREEFFKTRKVVERVQSDGTRLLSIAPKVPEISDVPGVSSVGHKVRKYSLVQFFTDSYLREKYSLGDKVYQSLREQALADADGAAARLQKLIRALPGCEDFRVGAGQYARSRSRAKDSVRRAAVAANPVENIMDARIFGDKITLYGPGSEDDLRWSVTAPVWETAVALQVHRIVQTVGTAPAMFALGSELTVLLVDIHNGYTFECPTVERHVGYQDEMQTVSSPMTLSVLSGVARTRLAELAKNVLPLEVDGEQVATAVSIGRLGVLVNAHVLDAAGESGARVLGSKIAANKQVSRDLWIARAGIPLEQAWVMRDAVPGEQVFIYHSVAGVPVVSPLVTVRSSDGVTLTMSLSSSMRAGMSGGAIVALRDLALLGVYEGVGSTQAVGLAFTAEHFTDLCTFDDVSSASPEQTTSDGGAWYERFKRRGLGQVIDSVIDSLIPLDFEEGFAGCAMATGDSVCTTVDLRDRAVTTGDSAVPLRFGKSGGDGLTMLRGDSSPFTTAMPKLMRQPVVSERVLFVARDRGGPYYTVRPAPITHVGLDDDSFAVGLPEDEDMLPLQGAAVVAVSDGAVLGMYSGRVYAAGRSVGVRCRSVRRGLDPVVALPAPVVLGKIFQMLRPETWPPGVAEAVLAYTGSAAADVRAYAAIGGAAMQAVMFDTFLEARVPVEEWQRKGELLQSDSAYAAVAERLGLAAELKSDDGRITLPGDGLKVTSMRAVAGAVYKFETLTTMRQFAAYCGLVVI